MNLLLFVSTLSLTFRFYDSEATSTFLRHLYPKIKISTVTEDAGDALFLTPLIQEKQIQEAQEQSIVPPFLNNIHSHSGFLTVNETFNSNMFFWFFPKTDTKTWKEAPLVLWLQGGPGASSLFGLFTENGPYVVTRGGVKRRRYSWSNQYNLLYIDNPVGTGFSFTEDEKGYATNQDDVARDLYSALTQFLQLFPELQYNDVYITGESYAGKYIPAIGYAILENNRKSDFKINLKGLFIGNGYSDPVNMLDYGEYLQKLGLIDEKQEENMKTLEEEIRVKILSSQWKEANDMMNLLIGDETSMFYNYTGLELYYDYTRENAGSDDPYMNDFIQSSKTRKNIHVGSLPYNDGEKVYEYLAEDVPKSVKPLVEILLEHYRIMFYSGQLDIIVGYPLSVKFLDNLEWSGAYDCKIAPRKKWYVKNRLAGYYKICGNLSEVLVRNAGHMVPTYQPRNAMSLLMSFINNEFQ